MLYYLHRDVRSTAYGAVLINLCIALLCLYAIYVVSHFVGIHEIACKAFAFFLHYFFLVASLAIVITAFFTAFTPFAESPKKKKAMYIAAFLINWSTSIPTSLCYAVTVITPILLSPWSLPFSPPPLSSPSTNPYLPPSLSLHSFPISLSFPISPTLHSFLPSSTAVLPVLAAVIAIAVNSDSYFSRDPSAL